MPCLDQSLTGEICSAVRPNGVSDCNIRAKWTKWDVLAVVVVCISCSGA